MPLVERRYAEALADISGKAGETDKFLEELRFITEVMDFQPDFRAFLLNPEMKANSKKELIENCFKSRIKDELVNFLKLLIDKGRIGHLSGILKEFTIITDKRRNILDITIISAIPLEKNQVDMIGEKMRQDYNASGIKTIVQIDSNLIGGVKVKIGDKIIDGTLKGRLEMLRETLITRW